MHQVPPTGRGKLSATFPGAPSHVGAMDDVLHSEQIGSRGKRLSGARLGDLPDGAMIARGGKAYAVRSGALDHGASLATEALAPVEGDVVVWKSDPALDGGGA